MDTPPTSAPTPATELGGAGLIGLTEARLGERLGTAIAARAWLKRYQPSWLRGDLLAGITLAAYLIPSGLGDASLARLSPQAGLYAVLFGGLVFWLFCGSRLTAVSVTSAISLLVGATLSGMAATSPNGAAGIDPSRFSALAACTAVLVGIIGVVAWLARAGSIVNFISESVMIGFKCGVALFIASTQIPKLLGIHSAHGSFWENTGHLLRHIGEINPTSALVGCVALAVLVLGKVFLRNKPVALVVVIAGICISAWLDLESRGVGMLGSVPQGLPVPGLSDIHWSDLNDLLPLAMACFLLGAVETAAIGRTFAAKTGVRFDANQEFLALGAANMAAGFFRGFPVSGGMSQSMVNDEAGAKTPLSGAFAATLVLIVTLFLSPLLRTLPQPVLAAVVLTAVAGLFRWSSLKHLWTADKSEWFVAVCALGGVLTSGLLRGVLIGAVISLALLIRRASTPHVAVLGRIPGTRRFSDLERHPDNERVPGVVIVRPETGLTYFNMDHVRELIEAHVRTCPESARLVLIDLSATPTVDMHSAHMLGELADELKKNGATLRVVETRSGVRDRLRAEGVAEALGGVNRFVSVADAVEAGTGPLT
ncbi:MAG: SulP family inorganic anion transporter [Phycisphaerales bacterium]